MSDIANVADELRNFSQRRKKPGTRRGGKTHPGLKHLQNADHDRIAERLLQTYWHGKLAAASVMQMGTNIEQLLCIRIDYRERFDMGRVLLSALTRSGLYRLAREDEDKNDSPHVIVATGKGLPDRHRFERTKFEPFPPWTAPFDADGNRLVEPSYPCPAELEYDPQLTDRDGSLFPWVTAVHKTVHKHF